MNSKAKATLATVGIVLVGGVSYLASLDSSEPGPPVEVRARVVGLTRHVEYEDGGGAYVVEVETEDGGREEREAPSPGCVRRPVAAPVEACLRRLPDGGAHDFGALNRFPEADAVGTGCQPVACSVVAGEDADGEE